jgi:GT2 family glycosyltransferase
VKPLGIIPTYMRGGLDLELVEVALATCRHTVGDDLDLLVVDDGSPDREAAEGVKILVERFDGEAVLKKRNDGFSRTVNVGLRRALNDGRDAVLINADIEFSNDSWLSAMTKQRRSDGSGLASIVGARLLYPNNLIQHAGVYFSLLSRTFDHIYRNGPHNLPEALHPRICPVTGALQFIRAECLEGIGVYDEHFRMGFEDVDYCVRAWQAGREVVYQPRCMATHHESMFRGNPSEQLAEWQWTSWLTFAEKWKETNFAEFMPNIF